MSKHITIRKGLDIRLKGEPEKILTNANFSSTVALKPTDFHGLTPKMVVKEGDQVKAGSVIFFDKYNEQVRYTSPVSGEIIEIKRGEKRRILEVKILADQEVKYESFKQGDPSSLSREEIKSAILESGCWGFIKQRPIDIVANPAQTPKSIFISAFDSNPLAPDYDFIVHGHGEDFQTGLNAIAKLTDGKVNLTVRGNIKPSEVFTKSKNVVVNQINGPHPAGNVGTQIHHIDPINKGEVVWVINPQDILTIGRLFNQGRFDATRIVALTGSQVKSPKYYRTVIGSNIASITHGQVNEGKNRYVSGNPLTGETVNSDGYMGFYHNQITVLPEGDEYKFFLTDGWLSPGLNKFSASRAYPTWLMPKKKFTIDTNTNGEERAYVMTGQYEKVFPFDIYPVHLIKSIMINDIESMENLGIYEVAPEDFAICEFVCTSKIDVQDVVRKGLDVIYRECM
ncbi:MAG: Na(+)-translocating NADH-quinone reductase subunit A [Flavobacteriales bacterium]